jgi:hypothetical protein
LKFQIDNFENFDIYRKTITAEPEKVGSIGRKCENVIRYQSLVKNNIACKSSKN